LFLSSATTVEVDVNDAGESDLIIVNGTVTLGGATLDVNEELGSTFDSDDPFNFLIIDNDGTDAVIGDFGNITNDLIFLTPTVSTDAGDGNDVQLTLVRAAVTPPPPVTGNCVTVGTVTTCMGDLTGGIASDGTAPDGQNFTAPPTETLIVNNVDAAGIVTDGADGINFEVAAPQDIIIDVDTTGTAGIVTDGGDGIDVDIEGGDGDITITSTGNLSTSGDGSEAIIASQDGGNGDINIASTGNISTSGENSDAIQADNNGMGDITITSNGDITTTGDGVDGILAIHTGVGDINITSNGDISTSGVAAGGITAIVSGPAGAGSGGDININTTGTVSASGIGLDIIASNAGNIAINSNGTVNGIIINSDFGGSINLRAMDITDDIIITQDNSEEEINLNITGTVSGEIEILKENGGFLTANVNNVVSDDDSAVIIVQDGGIGVSATFTSTGTISAADNGVQIATDNSNPQTISVNNVTGDSDGDGVGVGILSVINNSAFLSLDTLGDVSGGSEGILISAGTLTSTDPTPITIDTSGTVTGDVGIQVERTAGAGATLTNSGTITGRNGTAIDLIGEANDTVILTETAIINGGIEFSEGFDTLAFDAASGTTGTVSLFESGAALANDFEALEKRGAGTFIFEGDALPDTISGVYLSVLDGTAQVNAELQSVL